MKFAIASAILAQSIQDATTKEIPYRRMEIKSKIRKARLSNEVPSFSRQQMMPLLMNEAGKLQGDSEEVIGLIMECDPSSDDPDVGVLACGSGYVCVEDEGSILGGYCMNTSRDLEEMPILDEVPTFYCNLCGLGMGIDFDKVDAGQNASVTYPNAPLDPCFSLAFDAYVLGTFNATTCPETIEVAMAADCCVPYPYPCPDLCGSKSFNPYAQIPVPDGSMTYDCFGAASTINESECEAEFGVKVAKYCCEGTDGSETSGSMIPTTMPVLAPDGVTDAPVAESPVAAPIPDSSSTNPKSVWWSPGILVSMMSALTTTMTVVMSFQE